MSDNLKRSGSPLCDEDEEEEDYQILSQVAPDVKSLEVSEEEEEEEEKEPCSCSRSASQIGSKLSRVKKKRKIDGPGEY